MVSVTLCATASGVCVWLWEVIGECMREGNECERVRAPRACAHV